MTESLSQRLLDHVLAVGGGRVSVIGLSKNAGKTVTLNHLIRAAAARQVPLGLVSTGRDGEAQDAITELPKPRIWAPAGTWVATARGALTAGSAQVEAVAELPISTQFGPVTVGRVTIAGEVLLIGPGSVQRIGSMLRQVEERGARLCLVDGSFDRIAAAAPAVTGRVILAVGAAYSHSMLETVAQVRHVLDLFDLPLVPKTLITTVEQAAGQGPVSVISPQGEAWALPVLSALGDPGPILAALEGGSAALVLAGALSDRLVTALLRSSVSDRAIVVDDPTRVLVERNLWRRWRRRGGQVYVRTPVQLLAVTTNPHSPVGKNYDVHEFHEAVRALAGRPVFDLETGLA